MEALQRGEYPGVSSYRGRGVKGALSPGAHTLVHLDGEIGPLFSLVGLGEGGYGFTFIKVPGEVRSSD
eukprot:scaffold49341_cov63-Phaeocystis_antarctica.AAC.4